MTLGPLRISKALVAKQYRLAPSPRYARFLEGEEWRPRDGAWALVPTYAQPVQVHFSGDEIEGFFRSKKHAHPLATEPFPAEWAPLATLGSEEPIILVVHASDPSCPVATWDGRTLTRMAATLDGFLASLGSGPDAATSAEPVRDVSVAEISRLAERGIALADKRLTKARKKEIEACLEELDRVLPSLPGDDALRETEHENLPTHSLYARAKMLRALGRLEEACDTLEHAVVNGVPQTLEAPMLCRMLLVLDQPERILRIAERASTSVWSDLPVSWAIAHARLGDVEAAIQRISEAVERTVASKRERSVDVDPRHELRRRVDQTLAAIEEHAKAYADDLAELVSRLHALGA